MTRRWQARLCPDAHGPVCQLLSSWLGGRVRSQAYLSDRACIFLEPTSGLKLGATASPVQSMHTCKVLSARPASTAGMAFHG